MRQTMVERLKPAPIEATKHREKLIKTPKNYEVRILSGQFDLSAAFDEKKALTAIESNNPVEAYHVLHEKWNIKRHEAWDKSSDSKEKQIDTWAGNVSERVSDIFSGADLSDDLTEGVKTLGLSPTGKSKEEIKDYFAKTFYSRFAGDENHSIKGLSDAFFGIYENEKTRQACEKIMGQVRALEGILSPILTKDVYDKFVDVMEARVSATGKIHALSAKNGNVKLSKKWWTEIAYFEKQDFPPQEPIAKVEPLVIRNKRKRETATKIEQSRKNRVEQIQEAIETVKRGETPINPETGKPLIALSQEFAIKALEKQLKYAQEEISSHNQADQEEQILFPPPQNEPKASPVFKKGLGKKPDPGV